MKKPFIIVVVAFVLVGLVLWWSGFHFSTSYGIGRTIAVEKLGKIDCVWKSSSGAAITGTDGFHQANCEVKGGTLYLFGKPAAKPVRLVYRCIANDYELTLVSFDGQKKGSYVSK